MLFNILHCENPLSLLKEAYRNLVPGGIAGITHWNYDSSTPRGPSLDMRPPPEESRIWLEKAGFNPGNVIDLPPYHYGFRGIKE